MNIQLLTRTSILSLVVVMLCAAPLAFAQTKDTTAVDILGRLVVWRQMIWTSLNE